MTRLGVVVPHDSALLCEGCGYILDGLPGDSRCPECAKLIAESLPQRRRPPMWEEQPSPAAFWQTTGELIFRPAAFYRRTTTRTGLPSSRRFAHIHLLIASLFFGAAAYLQFQWLVELPGLAEVLRWNEGSLSAFAMLAGGMTGAAILSYLSLAAITRLAARLTAWEAAYRGFRLPLEVVKRGLHYHSAHCLPVAIVAFVTVAGYQVLLATGLLTGMSATKYLYVLCAEVVLCAGYLFKTYWTGMRNMLYANG